jgi:riboflavin synthase
MFTGIISHLGKVNKILHPNDWELLVDILDAENLDKSYNINSTPIGASISCSGICLTLKKVLNNTLFFDVSDETREKTNFSTWNSGTLLNLEKSLKVGDEIGGHFVYGHVDTTAIIQDIKKINGSYKITLNIKNRFVKYLASKGSVSVDGVSLTVNEVDEDYFTVNIIPYTWLHTSFKNYKIGTVVNIEIDILARYLESLNANN